MDNPEKLARLGTQDTGQRQTEQKTQKTKTMTTWTPSKLGVIPGARDGKHPDPDPIGRN